MATLLKVDGTEETVHPHKGKFTTGEIQSLIGCKWFEYITLADGRFMWIDEEGKQKSKLDNFTASDLLMDAGGMVGDYVAGDVLITSPGEVD